jgi:hypothetical protein
VLIVWELSLLCNLMTSCCLGGLCSFPSSATNLSVRRRAQTVLGSTQPVYKGANRPERKTNYSLLPCIEVKNEWKYISTPPHVLWRSDYTQWQSIRCKSLKCENMSRFEVLTALKMLVLEHRVDLQVNTQFSENTLYPSSGLT